MDDESACQAIAELSKPLGGRTALADGEHMDLIPAREDDSAVVGQLIRRMPGERGEAARRGWRGGAARPSPGAQIRGCRVHQNDSNLPQCAVAHMNRLP